MRKFSISSSLERRRQKRKKRKKFQNFVKLVLHGMIEEEKLQSKKNGSKPKRKFKIRQIGRESIRNFPFFQRKETNKCSSCLTESNSPLMELLPCKHCYCNDCFDYWMNEYFVGGPRKCITCGSEIWDAIDQEICEKKKKILKKGSFYLHKMDNCIKGVGVGLKKKKIMIERIKGKYDREEERKREKNLFLKKFTKFVDRSGKHK